MTSAEVAGFQLGTTQGIAALTITDDGTLSCFGAGILETNASLNLAGELDAESFFIINGHVDWSNGNLTAPGNGLLEIGASGTLSISGPNVKKFSGRLVNQGTVFCEATELYAAPGTIFTNSGFFIADTDLGLLPLPAGNPAPVFFNVGTLLAPGERGTISLATSWDFTNSGTLKVESNTIWQVYPGSDSHTEFANGTVFDGPGILRMPDGQPFGWDGTITLNGTLEYAASGFYGSSTWTGPGLLRWESGLLNSITFAPGFHALITGTAPKRISGLCTNFGILEWQGSGGMGAFELRFQNYGQLVIETNFNVGSPDPLPFGFNNFGTILVRSNFGTIPMSVGWHFTNYGTIKVETNSVLQMYPVDGAQMYFADGSLFDGDGVLSMPDTLPIGLDGTMTLNCTLQYGADGYYGSPRWTGPGLFLWESRGMSDFTFSTNFHVVVTGTGLYFLGNCTNQGIVRVLASTHANSAGATFYNDGQLLIEGGTTWEDPTVFVNQPGGTLRYAAHGESSSLSILTNRGTLELDSGFLSLTAGSISLGNGSCQVTLGGYAAGTDFGQLNIDSLNLGGSLVVTLTNGFVPTNGASFTVATANIASGQFTSLTLPVLPSSLTWRVQYLADRVNLQVVSPLQWTTVGLTNTAFQLSLGGPAANAYDIQASTNLTDWVTIETNSPFAGALIFTDTNAAQFNRRFYRARIYY